MTTSHPFAGFDDDVYSQADTDRLTSTMDTLSLSGNDHDRDLDGRVHRHEFGTLADGDDLASLHLSSAAGADGDVDVELDEFQDLPEHACKCVVPIFMLASFALLSLACLRAIIPLTPHPLHVCRSRMALAVNATDTAASTQLPVWPSV